MASEDKGETITCVALAFFFNSNQPSLEKFESLFVGLKSKREIQANQRTFPEGTPLTEEMYDFLEKAKVTITLDDFEKIPKSDIVRKIDSEYGTYLGEYSKSNLELFITEYSTRYEGEEGKLQIKKDKNVKVQIAYKMATKVSESSIFPNMRGYEFLGQRDPFTLLMKNKCFTKIQEAFKESFSGSYELYSSVDFYCVERGKKESIVSEVNQNFASLNPDEVLMSMVDNDDESNKHSYRQIVRKHMKSNALFPISMKFPKQAGQSPYLKLIGDTMLKDLTFQDIDPFTLVLAKVVAAKQDIDTFIKKFITIRFDEFSFSKESWEYPIEFNYDDYLGGVGKVEFTLASWKSGVFNGQWKINSLKGKGKQKTAWSGGMGAKPSFDVMYKYADFRNTILKEIKDIRLNTFKSMVSEDELDAPEMASMKADYKLALEELKAERFVTPIDMKKTIAFFNAYSRKHPTSHINAYYTKTATEFLHGFKVVFAAGKPPSERYVHAQTAYFLFNWGENGENELFVKKKIFMGIYGVLTKSVYQTFDANEVSNLIRKEIKGKEASYKTVPYVYLSYSGA